MDEKIYRERERVMNDVDYIISLSSLNWTSLKPSFSHSQSTAMSCVCVKTDHGGKRHQPYLNQCVSCTTWPGIHPETRWMPDWLPQHRPLWQNVKLSQRSHPSHRGVISLMFSPLYKDGRHYFNIVSMMWKAIVVYWPHVNLNLNAVFQVIAIVLNCPNFKGSQFCFGVLPMHPRSKTLDFSHNI